MTNRTYFSLLREAYFNPLTFTRQGGKSLISYAASKQSLPNRNNRSSRTEFCNLNTLPDSRKEALPHEQIIRK